MSQSADFSSIFHGNINKITEDNPYFRRILATTPNMQLVVMSLAPFGDIGFEIHPYTTQFIRVEKGIGMAIVNNVSYELFDGVAIIIPLNTKHNIINTSQYEPLKLYTIYSPPNHPTNRLDVIKPQYED